MRLLVLAMCLVLAGCGEKTNFAGRNEMQSMAHDEALDATNPEFAEVNASVANLQNSLNEANAQINNLEDERQGLASRIDTLEMHDRDVRAKLSM